MLVQIENDKHLIRDTTNRAILNTDRAGLERYEQQEINSKVIKLEKDITDIKDMLRELVQMKAPNGN